MGLLVKTLLTHLPLGSCLTVFVHMHAVVGAQPPLLLSFRVREHINQENQPITLTVSSTGQECRQMSVLKTFRTA